jgi:fatty-acyl-CoA synthase
MLDSPTLVQRLSDAADMQIPGSGIVFIDRKERETLFSWKQIHDRAHAAAGYFQAAGLKPGDRVAIVLPTCIEFMDAFFGCQTAGLIPVPLYPPVRLGRLEEYYAKTGAMLREVEASAVVCDRRVRRVFGQVIRRYSPPLGMMAAEDLCQGPPAEAAEVGADTIAMAQFSSGTTKAPKPVGLTHRQILSNVDAILSQVPILQDPPHVPAGCSWLPLYHDMGLIGCIFPAMSVPGKLALIPPEAFLSNPSLWLRAISRHHAIVSPAPNFAYALCAERIKDGELEGCDLSGWKLALNGAEPVAPAHLRAFLQRFSRYGLLPEAICPVYGLAEAALAVTFSDSTKPFLTRHFNRDKMADGLAEEVSRESDSSMEIVGVGRPLPGFGIQIRSVQGSPLPEGRIGQIWAAGPSLMSGYLNGAPSPLRGGWLDTGDIGFEYGGELYISGRSKDVVILRGRNHSPHDIEQAVDCIPGVRTGCAAALGEQSENGEQLLLFLEYREMREDLAEECRRAVLSATGLDPDLVVLLEPGTLPRTSSGKIRRQETLKRFRDGSLLPPQKVGVVMLAGAMAKSMLGYIQSRSS